MKINHKYGYLIVDDKYFAIEAKDGITTWKEVKGIKEMAEKADKIAEKIKDNLNRKAIVKESVMKLSKKELDKLYDMLFKSKRNYKPRTREGACVDMKIGKFILPIVEDIELK